MKVVNGMTVYEGEDPCSLDEYSAKIAQEVSKLIQDNKYDDTLIKQEQQTQNEEISNNTKKNKNQDKQIAQLQKENTALKSQIPTGEVEGEYINISDSSNLELVDFNVEGKTVQDGIPTVELPVEIKGCGEDGNISVVKSNGNLAKFDENYFEVTENSIKNIKGINGVKLMQHIKLKKGQTLYTRLKLFSTNAVTFTSYIKTKDITTELNILKYVNISSLQLNTNYDKSYTATEDCEIIYRAWGNSDSSSFEFQFTASLDEAIDYIKHEDKEYVVPTQEPFYEGDTFVKIDGVRYEKHLKNKLIFDGTESMSTSGSQNSIYQFNITINELDIAEDDDYIDKNKVASNYFSKVNKWTNSWLIDNVVLQMIREPRVRFQTSKFTTLTDFKAKLTELYNAGTPLYIVYPLATPKLIPCTEDQNTVLDELENSSTYKNITYIYSNDEIEPKIKLQYYKDLETLFNKINAVATATVQEVQND